LEYFFLGRTSLRARTVNDNHLLGEQMMTHFPRATTWQLPRVQLRFEAIPIVMGIVNVTPDSFSDGGRHFDPVRAVDFALQLVEQGARILDIGGESTRPYSTVVDADEELRRILPVIQSLAKQTKIPLSIDTSKPSVARVAVDAGAQIINDVTGFRDPEMLRLAAQSGAAVCAMHMLRTPHTTMSSMKFTLISETDATCCSPPVFRESEFASTRGSVLGRHTSTTWL
jgi:dihydropteroate synthase